jgi:heavy metal sensor kinase
VSIRLRLTILNTLILLTALVLFGLAVYFVLQATLLAQIDDNLQSVAVQVRSETQALALRDATFLSIPDELDVFQSGSIFITIINVRGEVIARSDNLANFDRVLDPAGRTQENTFTTVVYGDQTLRVLTMPLFVEAPDGRALIGHLQVARLIDIYPALDRIKLTLVLTGMGAVTFSLLVGVIIINNLLRPLDNVTALALQITRADDLSRRLPDTGRRDELGTLTMVMNQTLERLERLFRAQQRFLADVSHELRTPLTTIRGNVDLMHRMNSADPTMLDIIRDEVQRMSRLVGDLMLLARADSGGLPIHRTAVALDTVLLDVYRQARHLAPEAEIVLQDVDQVSVLGDADRLKQLILNLVDNAVKYTPAGGRVTMSLAQVDGRAEIQIADSGIGIPESDLPLIFERFYRVDKSRSRAQGGSGLGLSIAKWIAQAHSGDIRVTSQVGQGSVFTVVLPVMNARYSVNGARNGEGVAASGVATGANQRS